MSKDRKAQRGFVRSVWLATAVAALASSDGRRFCTSGRAKAQSHTHTHIKHIWYCSKNLGSLPCFVSIVLRVTSKPSHQPWPRGPWEPARPRGTAGSKSRPKRPPLVGRRSEGEEGQLIDCQHAPVIIRTLGLFGAAAFKVVAFFSTARLASRPPFGSGCFAAISGVSVPSTAGTVAVAAASSAGCTRGALMWVVVALGASSSSRSPPSCQSS